MNGNLCEKSIASASKKVALQQELFGRWHQPIGLGAKFLPPGAPFFQPNQRQDQKRHEAECQSPERQPCHHIEHEAPLPRNAQPSR